MDILFQILLALGSPAFEGLMTRLGGPKLVIGEPYIDSRPFVESIKNIPEFHEYVPSGGTISPSHLDVMRKKGQISDGGFSMMYYIHLPIHNKQISRIPNSTAKQVFAKLKFSDLDSNLIGDGVEFDGRWEKTRQPSAFEDLEELRFKDILPEDKQVLDIAMRTVRGGCWYVMNNDSYKTQKYPVNLLKEEGFIFHLSLNGSNIFMKSIRYKFLSKGQGGKPEFVRI